jgi:predicted RNase H-like nuclease
MSRQAFGILPKSRKVDGVLAADGSLAPRVVEVHPEVSFLLMNDGTAMRHGKKKTAGKAERRALLEARRPSSIEHMRASLRGQDYALDDLIDAMAALWSARRWVSGKARVLGDPAVRDRKGLSMRMERPARTSVCERSRGPPDIESVG